MSTQPDIVKARTFRDGASQGKRLLPALEPAFVAADERTATDLLRFAQRLGAELQYYDENNQPRGDWSPFFAGDVEELIAYLEEPQRFAKHDELDQLAEPHRVLFLAFLSLLRHPQQQFRELTQRHLDYAYKTVLQLAEKPATADSVHVIFDPALGVAEHRLPQGTLLHAGQDSQGVDLHYATDEDIIVNQAQVAAIKTLHVAEQYIDLRSIHLRHERDDEGFERMLRWALGRPQQGDPLPGLTGPGDQQAADIVTLKALYNRIEDLAPETVPPADKTYILDQLFFVTLEDFLYCLQVHTRELAARLAGASAEPPTEEEWTQVYQRVERAYRKKINWQRRRTLKEAHRDPDTDDQGGFRQMLEAALGQAGPGAELAEMADGADPVETLFQSNVELIHGSSEAQYIRDQLSTNLEDFEKIRRVWQETAGERAAAAWEEVYRLLEKAQTRKRNFTYPPIGRTETRHVYASTVAEAREDQATGPVRFKTFHHTAPNDVAALPAVPAPQPPGFAVSSPLLRLHEGQRRITLTLACQQGTLDREALAELDGSGHSPFDLYLSSAGQWLKVPQSAITFKVGGFILEESWRMFNSADLALFCTAEDAFGSGGSYPSLVFGDGMIYKVDGVESSGSVRLITAGFIPGGDGAVKKYHHLELIDNSEGEPIAWPKIAVSADERTITADNDKFTPSHEGKYVFSRDGRIYLIENFIHARRIKVHLWGQIPEKGTNAIHSEIAFYDTPTILPNAALDRVSFGEDISNVFDLQDNGTVLVLDNGQVLRITGAGGGKSANVVVVGRVPAASVPEGKIYQYGPAAIYTNSLQLGVTLDSAHPPILPVLADATTLALDTAEPVLKVLLKPVEEAGDEAGSSAYERLKSISLARFRLQVAVDNVQELLLRNDDSVLSPKNPFLPFGHTPQAGAGVYFTHPEISLKKLDSLALRLEWMGLPQDFASHYAAYAQTGVMAAPLNNSSFQASLRLLNNRTWSRIEAPKRLFAEDGDELRSSIQLRYRNFDIAGYAADPTVVEPGADDPFEQRRYFKLELESPDFAHELHALVMNKVALATPEDLVQDAQGQQIATRSLTVYPPYTPQIKTITLDYTASAEVDLTDPRRDQQDCRIVQLHPFGYVDMLRGDGTILTDYLLPHYAVQGAVFIGVRALRPPQDVSLLFQLVPGSANVELAKPAIRWGYLDADRWLDLSDTQLLADSTNGLLNSGIVRLSLPAAGAGQNHLLPGGLYWLRASVAGNAAAIPDTLDVQTQAVRATFQDKGNAADHLSRPLLAESITDLVTREPAIVAVSQPYSSFDGKMREESHSFYTRVSERLRHKGRALTTWDYERLTLARFPQLYKVKCLSQANQTGRASAAGVTVVVVPDIANTAPFYPLEPKAPLYLLEEIKAYLTGHASPFVRLAVKNPRYEQIKYRIGVRFHPGYEQGYYLKQLNEDLQRFLSPWAYEEQADIPFGSSIHSSAVIHFIETRDYIDYVANLKLIEQLAIDDDVEGGAAGRYYTINETNLAQVRQPDAILVSAPEHIIDLISGEHYDEEEFEGIGYMIIGIDFNVQE